MTGINENRMKCERPMKDWQNLDLYTAFHQVVIWFDLCNIFLLIYLLTESSGFLLRVLHSGERGGSDGGKLFLRPPGSGATELPGIKPVQHSGCISVWLLGWYYLCSINFIYKFIHFIFMKWCGLMLQDLG